MSRPHSHDWQQKGMRVRADTVIIACVLFTAALLSLIPSSVANALTGRNETALTALDGGFREVALLLGHLGVTCLAMILIGLIVTWTGYVKHARPAWFVMLVLTWAWAFPLFVLPNLTVRWAISFPELLYDAIHQSGPPRMAVESSLMFLLMIIALLLPVRSFFGTSGEDVEHAPSPKLVAGSVVALVIVIAVLAWVHTRVYEIPPEMLKSGQQMPSPPPPPR